MSDPIVPVGATELEVSDSQALLAIDGSLFEKWAAKAFLNVLLGQVQLVRRDKRWISVNSHQLEEIVFRGVPFPNKHGLYALPYGVTMFDKAPSRPQHISVAVIEKEVEIVHTGEMVRFPLFLHIASFGVELILHANMTSVDNAAFDAIAASYWESPNIKQASFHPEVWEFYLPELDAAPSADKKPPRVIRFSWPTSASSTPAPAAPGAPGTS